MLGKLLTFLGPKTASCGAPTRSGTARPRIRSTPSAPSRSRPRLQERHGYPALTTQAKDLILGGNAVRLYGI